MRPIRSLKKNLGPIVATSGVLVALGLTATPMLSVWEARDAAATSAPTVSSDDFSGTVPNQIAVELHNDADVAAIESKYGIDLRPNSMESKDDHIYVADLPKRMSESSVINALRGDSRIEVAEPNLIVSLSEGDFDETAGNSSRDQMVLARQENREEISSASLAGLSQDESFSLAGAPNDPRYGEQWNFRMIGMEDAWARTRGKGVVVAVIDTGVAAGSPSAKGAPCRDFGDTKVLPGYNFVDNNSDAYDDHAHGTHVAGTIAESTNNNEGVAGIAYEATILPVKVLSAQGGGTAAGVADGIRYAADQGANVINMSLGSSRSSDVIKKACQYAAKKGVVIVCAAGNGFGEPVGYPAAYPECIAVSSVGPTGQIAKYSSYGKQVALAAPGGDMMESRNPADGILQNTNYNPDAGGHGDDYYAFQGTSMACPHVAGVAALIEAEGVKDPAKVRDILTKTAIPNGDAKKYGAGILSAAGATQRAAQVEGPKVRHLIFAVVGALILLSGGGGLRKRYGLRLAMVGALAVGMFGPDWFADRVGADSILNLLTFSVLLPILLFTATRRGPGIKVAGMLSLGVAMNLFANFRNDTLPFTTSTFGDSALPWTMANLGAALALGCAAAWRAHRATTRR